MTETEQQPKRSRAEWITFSIASFILAIIVSLVGYTWLNEKNQPPILSVTKKQTIREINGQFYVPFEVVNSGGDTAESVQIMAELLINGKVTETGEQQIDFLSSGESEEGAFIFSHNPRQGQLNLRVGSYKLP
ncbi:MAG: TIGR02588 family protein [Nostoc sp.]|uniref:TIGR02588 family protein n=1 Tax=Nostoc punctiforme NIES-2108 TaxID=1356359 RepID=A0A367RP15_NOSPU|nr:MULTISPECIES: TIGR02588 family protein [unclassified Nostoc]MBN3878599.1 TIGR02588 family protein [Nostoc sp. JL23]MBN3888741.1 TIGR02588 family protein [Nostoc sp. JL31]RCJ37601.1 TIGR02588 family protein [Nostoc punctiforme NIES-2108]